MCLCSWPHRVRMCACDSGLDLAFPEQLLHKPGEASMHGRHALSNWFGHRVVCTSAFPPCVQTDLHKAEIWIPMRHQLLEFPWPVQDVFTAVLVNFYSSIAFLLLWFLVFGLTLHLIRAVYWPAVPVGAEKGEGCWRCSLPCFSAMRPCGW